MPCLRPVSHDRRRRGKHICRNYVSKFVYTERVCEFPEKSASSLHIGHFSTLQQEESNFFVNSLANTSAYPRTSASSKTNTRYRRSKHPKTRGNSRHYRQRMSWIVFADTSMRTATLVAATIDVLSRTIFGHYGTKNFSCHSMVANYIYLKSRSSTLFIWCLFNLLLNLFWYCDGAYIPHFCLACRDQCGSVRM